MKLAGIVVASFLLSGCLANRWNQLQAWYQNCMANASDQNAARYCSDTYRVQAQALMGYQQAILNSRPRQTSCWNNGYTVQCTQY